MGLLRWIRGGDNSPTAAMMSAGLAEIAGLFQPTRHKQTEHVEESTRRRLDLATGSGIDLDRGIAVIRRRPTAPDAPTATAPDAPAGTAPDAPAGTAPDAPAGTAPVQANDSATGTR